MAKTVIIESSARHVHLSRKDLDILFGEGYELGVKKELSQPGQFLSQEKVLLEGPKSSIKASILGPVRANTQVELSATDARGLGVIAPLRKSGDIKGSGKIKITGPKGSIELEEGVIIAKRHIHLSPEAAEAFGVKDKQIVKVKVGGPRALVFDEVVIRVGPDFKTFMHIDVDEANAAGISGATPGEII